MNPNSPCPILRIGVEVLFSGAFLQATRGKLPGGWSCSGDYPTHFAHPLRYLSFKRRIDGERSSYVYLLRTDPETLTVAGIVPGTDKTTISEQRALLDNFRACVLDLPKTRVYPVAAVHPENVAEFGPPPEVRKVLNHWRGLLNHGAGFHPFDPSDWQWLMVNLHLTRRSIAFDWLIDTFSLKHTIPERALDRLENRFVSSMELLRCYDDGLDFKRQADRKRSSVPLNDQPSTA